MQTSSTLAFLLMVWVALAEPVRASDGLRDCSSVDYWDELECNSCCRLVVGRMVDLRGTRRRKECTCFGGQEAISADLESVGRLGIGPPISTSPPTRAQAEPERKEKPKRADPFGEHLARAKAQADTIEALNERAERQAQTMRQHHSKAREQLEALRAETQKLRGSHK